MVSRSAASHSWWDDLFDLDRFDRDELGLDPEEDQEDCDDEDEEKEEEEEEE